MKWSQVDLLNHDDSPVGDQCVHLHGTFDDYEALLRMRGEKAVPRISYLQGNIVIVMPSRDHESIKSVIGRLVEVWCDWRHKRFGTFGSWTLKDRRLERGAEPDECYVFDEPDPARPHLAIEVVWTSVGINKLEIYRLLGVREVWVWRRGRITVHVLRGDRYEEVAASEVLPGIDLDKLLTFLDRPMTSDAVRDYRSHLMAKPDAGR